MGFSLAQCRRYYREINENKMSPELLHYAKGNEAGFISALHERIDILERQGRQKTYFDVTQEFEASAVDVDFMGKTGKGLTTQIVGDESVDVMCAGGVASHASQPLPPAGFEQVKLARKLAALVREKDGIKTASVTKMPKVISDIDYSSHANVMAIALRGSVRGNMANVMNDMTAAAAVSQLAYRKPPKALSNAIDDYQGFKYVTSNLQPRKQAFKTEQANKKAIKTMLNVYPGQKSGPGNLAAAHMDGIPLSGKMRTMFDCVQDFKYVEADWYFVTGAKFQVYNSIFANIKARREADNNDRPFILSYESDNDLIPDVVAKHVVLDESGAISKVLCTGILTGRMAPRPSKLITSAYIDFTEPARGSRDRITIDADNARKIFNSKKKIIENFSHYQIYGSYLAMSFPKDYKKHEKYTLADSAEWCVDETYVPSVMGRKGIFIYTDHMTGLAAPDMAQLMINMIYHSIMYVYTGRHLRKFVECEFPTTISVDFAIRTTIMNVSTCVVGTVQAIGDVLGKKFQKAIEDKINEIKVRKIREDQEKARELKLENEERVKKAEEQGS
jgi:hypothetical protein